MLRLANAPQYRESRIVFTRALLAMAASTRLVFLATAVVFHLVYLLSIFDIYFVSPIVSGMRLVGVERPASAKAPADRLVLIVGESVRAPLLIHFIAAPLIVCSR